MKKEYINIGFGSIVSAGKIVALISPDSAPIKRLVTVARDQERLIDATFGRRTRSVIIMESGQVVLSAIQTDTLGRRLYDFNETDYQCELEDEAVQSTEYDSAVEET
ncbi:MAG: DUF370 domain-containing protein [Oscillospiraceae bacterium]|jgi:regulator of extracellular matrix RemA (YlzA/DUF370 family)|nr:DUF370 domain-containing protein [Oscillospiraceae bacterium]